MAKFQLGDTVFVVRHDAVDVEGPLIITRKAGSWMWASNGANNYRSRFFKSEADALRYALWCCALERQKLESQVDELAKKESEMSERHCVISDGFRFAGHFPDNIFYGRHGKPEA